MYWIRLKMVIEDKSASEALKERILAIKDKRFTTLEAERPPRHKTDRSQEQAASTRCSEEQGTTSGAPDTLLDTSIIDNTPILGEGGFFEELYKDWLHAKLCDRYLTDHE